MLTAVLGFLNGGDMPEVINQTILVLIPKVVNPEELTQFRPIFLCNVIYKICSKVLANRLRLILDEVVSEEQSFIPRRLITDNVLIAYECIHYLRNKKGKSGACAIKLDVTKAYDRVEWSYLHAIMVALGFPVGWCNLIMKCVSSVSFVVRVNGSPHPSSPPGALDRVTQSPVLIPSMLGGLDMSAEIQGTLIYLERSSGKSTCPTRIAEILEHYNRGSGQLVNKNKSAIFFSENCDDNSKSEVHEAL